ELPPERRRAPRAVRRRLPGRHLRRARRRVLQHAGAPQRRVRPPVRGEPAARAADPRGARDHLRPERSRDRREPAGLLGVGGEPERGLAARRARAARRDDRPQREADRGRRAPLPARAQPADGGARGRALRRGVGARGAPLGVPGARHPVGAEALLPGRRGGGLVHRLHRRDHGERAFVAGLQGVQERAADREGRAREAVRARAPRPRGSAVRRGGRARPARERLGAPWAVDHGAGGRAAAPHEHRPRAPALHRRAVRRLAHRRRHRDGPAHRRGARAAQRAHVRPQPVHRGHPGQLLGLAEHRRAPPAVQQGDPGALPPGVHLEARHVGDRDAGEARPPRGADGRPVHRRLPVRQPLLPLLGQAGARQREPHARHRGVVRRLLLPARPAPRPLAADRGRRGAGLRAALGNRPARGGAAALPGKGLPDVLQQDVRRARLDERGDAQPLDRAGGERADGGEHGALLHRARHRRHGGEAGDRAPRAAARAALQALRGRHGRAAQRAGGRGLGGDGARLGDRGARAGGEDRHRAELARRRPRLVRRLRAGQGPGDRRVGHARVRRARVARRAHREQHRGQAPEAAARPRAADRGRV
ncbi:MAG: Peptidoglycan D,D-transpeptidase MrdA, partial [uncultured Gemmatimonadaceae bacterium]